MNEPNMVVVCNTTRAVAVLQFMRRWSPALRYIPGARLFLVSLAVALVEVKVAQ